MTYSFLRADFRFSSSMSSWIPLSLESSRRFNVCSRMARLCGCCWAWDNTETSGISSSFYKQEQNYTAHEYNIYIILDNTDKLKIFGLWFASPMLVNALPTELRSHVCMFNVGRALYTSKLKSRVQFPPSSMLVNALYQLSYEVMSVQCRFNVGKALYTSKLKSRVQFPPSSMLVNALPTGQRSHVGWMSAEHCTSKLKSQVQFPPSSMLVNALPTELRSHVSSMSVQCWQSIVY
jgi:hypothetical protein